MQSLQFARIINNFTINLRRVAAVNRLILYTGLFISVWLSSSHKTAEKEQLKGENNALKIAKKAQTICLIMSVLIACTKI